MIKIRNNVDVFQIAKEYNFKKVKSVKDYLVYTDHSKNRMIIYPFADNLIELYINFELCEPVLIDITRSGVMHVLTELYRRNLIYTEKGD